MNCIKCGSPTNGNEELCINCATDELEIIDFPEDIVDIIDIYPSDGINVDNFIDTITDKLEQTEGIVDVPGIIGQTIEEIKTNKKAKKKKKTPKKNDSPKFDPEFIIILVLLIVSVCTNAFLIIKGGNTLAKNSPKNNTEQQIQLSTYSRYTFEMPVDWISGETNGQLTVYDKTETWAATTKIVDDVDYDTFISNKDKFPKEMLSIKYHFTSSYIKETNNKRNYLFKGKYFDDYSVYVIITELPNRTLAVTDLKFKSEVNDVILNKILNMCGSIQQKDTNLFNDNFEFKDFSDIILDTGKNKE